MHFVNGADQHPGSRKETEEGRKDTIRFQKQQNGRVQKSVRWMRRKAGKWWKKTSPRMLELLWLVKRARKPMANRRNEEIEYYVIVGRFR